jgi:hypothetical protein
MPPRARYDCQFLALLRKAEETDSIHTQAQILRLRDNIRLAFARKVPIASREAIDYFSDKALCIKILPLHMAELFDAKVNPLVRDFRGISHELDSLLNSFADVDDICMVGYMISKQESSRY